MLALSSWILSACEVSASSRNAAPRLDGRNAAEWAIASCEDDFKEEVSHLDSRGLMWFVMLGAFCECLMQSLFASGRLQLSHWRITSTWRMVKLRCAWKDRSCCCRSDLSYLVKVKVHVGDISYRATMRQYWIIIGKYSVCTVTVTKSKYTSLYEFPVLAPACHRGFDDGAMHLANFVLYSCIGHVWHRLFHSVFQAAWLLVEVLRHFWALIIFILILISMPTPTRLTIASLKLESWMIENRLGIGFLPLSGFLQLAFRDNCCCWSCSPAHICPGLALQLGPTYRPRREFRGKKSAGQEIHDCPRLLFGQGIFLAIAALHEGLRLLSCCVLWLILVYIVTVCSL